MLIPAWKVIFTTPITKDVYPVRLDAEDANQLIFQIVLDVIKVTTHQQEKTERQDASDALQTAKAVPAPHRARLVLLDTLYLLIKPNVK